MRRDEERVHESRERKEKRNYMNWEKRRERGNRL